MANSVLAKMAVQISANTAEFNKALQATSSNLKSFTSGIQNIAAQVGIAFGVQQVASFALEVSKLAGQAEGVETAFNRLPNSIRLMNELKKATGGTVSELELMKRAVMASNFDISLEALPRLLEFATLRAQQTGQSVDYLVDSIVTGIGRKSKLILDNLGISAAQLSFELNGVSTEAATVGQVADAVGRIAEKNLVNMAGFSENAATKMQRLAASWENLKIAIGKEANSNGVFGGLVDTLTQTFDVFSSDNLSKLQKFQTYLVAAFKPQYLQEFTKALKEVDAELEKTKQLSEQIIDVRLENSAQQLINAFGGVSNAIDQMTNHLDENQEIFLKAGIGLDTFDKVLAVLNKRLAQNQPLLINQIDTINEYREEIKKLTEQNENLSLTDATKIHQNGILIEQYEAQIKKLQDLAKVKRDVMKMEDIEPSPTFSKPRTPFSMDEIAPDGRTDITGFGFNTNMSEEMIDNLKTLQSEVLSITQSMSDSFISLGEDILFAFGAGNKDNNLGRGLLMSLARFGSMYGKQLIALGIAKKAEFGITGNPVTLARGIQATIAGGALVAASAVLGGVASSMGSGSSGSSGSGGSGISSGSTRLATNAAQNEFSYETVIRGQDLYVILSTYNKNRNRTSAIGG